MQTVPLQRAARVFLDGSAIADVEGLARELRTLGIQAETSTDAVAGADLIVASPELATRGVPWIAIVAADDTSAFAQALERGATAVLGRDAETAQVAQSVRLAVRDLDRLRVQERIADLLARVECAAGVGSFEYEPHDGRLWLSAEARRLLGIPEGVTGDLRAVVLARIAPGEQRRFSEWLTLLGSSAVAREIEWRLNGAGESLAWVRFSVPASSGPARLVRGVIEEWAEPVPDETAVGEPDVQSDARQLYGALASAIEASELRGASVAVYVVDSEELRALTTSLTRGNQEHVLHSLASRMRAALRDVGGSELADAPRSAPFFGRASGGGLIVVVPGLRRRDDLHAIGARLASWLSKPVHLGGRELALSACIGVTSSSLDCHDSEELVRRAETAAYCARRDDRGRVELWIPSMDSEAFERLSLEMALRRALARDEFVLHYQPRVDIRTGRIVGMEALVRWQHPDLGFVAPARFIPVAEETGLIVPIGAHVMRTACRQAQAWNDAGLTPIRMSVNLSPLQLHDRGLLGTIEECLRVSRLPAERLELELTEGALMKDPASDVQLLQQIKSLGAHLSIDDFGTGHSSLAYLRRFPVDALKIDRSFLRDATSRPDDASIFSAIVLMGRSLKMTVVAEGVETSAQLALLRVMRADEAQGFLLSPPVPAEQAARLLAKGSLGLAAA